jgi:hypothetical protein
MHAVCAENQSSLQQYSDWVLRCDGVRHPAAASASDNYPVVADLLVDE